MALAGARQTCLACDPEPSTIVYNVDGRLHSGLRKGKWFYYIRISRLADPGRYSVVWEGADHETLEAEYSITAEQVERIKDIYVRPRYEKGGRK